MCDPPSAPALSGIVGLVLVTSILDSESATSAPPVNVLSAWSLSLWERLGEGATLTKLTAFFRFPPYPSPFGRG